MDRRNAPFVQGLLIFFVCFVAINKVLYLWAVFSGRWRGRPDLGVDVGTDVLMCVIAGVAFWLIRSGRFRLAVSLFIGTVLGVTVIGYAFIDVKVVAFEAFPLMLLALGGLVLGARALWIIASVQVLGYLVCLASNLLGIAPEPESPLVAVGIIVSTAGAYLLIAIIVGSTVNTLRESLDEAVAKSRRLEQEMAERERAQEQLVHAQKMEVVGRVASGVAHDFDNVLSVIQGYASRRERLADAGTSALVEAMEGIQIAAERASLVSRKLLRFGRFDSEHAEVLDLCAVLRDVRPMLRQLFGARIHSALELPEAPLWVKLDRSQLELMLLSIASNARDAMPDGGRFTLCAQGGTKGMVEIALQDTGAGIAPDVAEHIFDPFYTTKPIGKGTGLGLSVVHDVLEQAGGAIEVHSVEGQGTTFTLRIPCAPARDVRDQASASPANR